MKNTRPDWLGISVVGLKAAFDIMIAFVDTLEDAQLSRILYTTPDTSVELLIVKQCC